MSASPAPLPRVERSSLATALIITRREVKDSLRDWRIMTPIFILTLVFPALMNFTAQLATDWVARYNAPIVGERLIPFLLMIVGFFPISFSLVIALETFVGEKERNSIEPLMSMPVTDQELYMGKMLAALFVPLLASYLGITVYLVSLYIFVGWRADFWLLTQMFLLTTTEGLVMVSGAVVVSSQTTSVRAANLLASFIIIPMTLLLQVESILLFWGNYNVIWLIILGLLVVDLILIRMGVRIFNREEILSKEMDELNLKSIWRDFKGHFLRPPAQPNRRNKTEAVPFSLLRVWRQDIPQLLASHKLPLGLVVLLLTGSAIGGAFFAPHYPLPPDSLNLNNLQTGAFDQANLTGFLPGFTPAGILLHNMRVLVLSALLGIFSFGALAVILVMASMALVGYFAGAAGLAGHNSAMFLATFILPHGLFEIMAVMISTAFALRMGAALIAPPEGLDVGQGFLYTLANFTKIFIFVVIPLLLIAAVIETQITPLLVYRVYGGG